MPVTQAEVESFHTFASAKVHDSSVESMSDLFALWLIENPTLEEREATLTAIREGLADIDAGRVSSLDDVDRRIRAKFGWDEPA